MLVLHVINVNQDYYGLCNCFFQEKDCSTFALVEKKGEWESNLYYLPSICGGTTS